MPIVEEPTGIEVISVVWSGKEKRGKFYLYDPDGETVEPGDIVLVPTFDQAKNREITREAIVAEGNHRIDPETLKRAPKKIISVVRPQEAAPIEQPREEPIVISSEVTTPEETANTSDTKKGFVHALKQWLHLN